jgi:hypothetical protein
MGGFKNECPQVRRFRLFLAIALPLRLTTRPGCGRLTARGSVRVVKRCCAELRYTVHAGTRESPAHRGKAPRADAQPLDRPVGPVASTGNALRPLGGSEFPNRHGALEKLPLLRGTCYIAGLALSFKNKRTPVTDLVVSFASSIPGGIVASEF